MATLKKIVFPKFGEPAEFPLITRQEYEKRIAAAIERMKQRGLKFLVIYADREHSANIAYLTGFEPRFEEALFLLSDAGKRKLLAGNECIGYLPKNGPKFETELFQEFSLMGQPREHTRALRDILEYFGIGDGTTVGCVGWKYFSKNIIAGEKFALDVPAYLADTLRESAGRENVVNATGILMGVSAGLRLFNSAAQIAQFEYAAVRTSMSVLEEIRHIKPGVTERELSKFLWDGGLPHTCHTMISSGEKAKQGLASPSDNRVKKGDAFTTALGLPGSLTARAGVVAKGPADLPAKSREFYHRLAENYFDVFTTWYETVRVGATAGQVVSAVEAARDKKCYDFALNPGHYIHLDEWLHSPFWPGSTVELRSGMALQMDIIPVSKGPFFCVNAEDGIVLADAALRKEIAKKLPACWKRMEARRKFAQKVIGVNIHESVLLLSNTPMMFAPYLLCSDRVFVK